jgi:acetyl esterase/lipase
MKVEMSCSTSSTVFAGLFRMAITFCLLWCCLIRGSATAEDPQPETLWPGRPPGPPALVKGDEQDMTKPEDKLIAGKRIIKLGNVSTPQMHVYLPPQETANGGAVVICPGGGFSILAWDLEGTEVAQWLNSLGLAAIVLKYRVPTREHEAAGKWQGPVMDAQRAISLTRSRAEQWGIDPGRIGILGFSAGGETAALVAVKQGKRLYQPIDDVDQVSCAADFAMLIYPGGIAEDDGSLKEDYAVNSQTPPMFFVHAADDRVTCLSSTALFTALKKADVPAEMHIYASGGHGYGSRSTDSAVTQWPQQAEGWLKTMELLTASTSVR